MRKKPIRLQRYLDILDFPSTEQPQKSIPRPFPSQSKIIRSFVNQTVQHSKELLPGSIHLQQSSLRRCLDAIIVLILFILLSYARGTSYKATDRSLSLFSLSSLKKKAFSSLCSIGGLKFVFRAASRAFDDSGLSHTKHIPLGNL